MNPEVYSCISGELPKISDLNSITWRHRMFENSDGKQTIRSYQSMQMQCLQEGMKNGNKSCPIDLYAQLEYVQDLKLFKTMIHFNKGHVKLLQITDSDAENAFMQSLDPGVFTSLETLSVKQCDTEPVWLADILTESARTLNFLTISLGNSSLSGISITALTGLTCLQSLYLAYVEMTYINLECLYAYISQTTTLTQLKLVYIDCSDHEESNCDVTLDLHHLKKLKLLHLDTVSLTELRVNPACLEKLVFQPPLREMTDRASATLWQDLQAVPLLSSLELNFMNSCQEMIQTIATLTQLQYLKLEWINMDDVIPLSPAMKKLERVELFSVTMTYAEWRELLLSVGGLQHPVTVELYKCKGPSRQEWRTIGNVIKTTPTLSLLQDLRIDSTLNPPKCSASLTLKSIPVL